MTTPDDTLKCVLQQMSMETGLSIAVIHPGALRGDEAAEAFSGLADSQIERLKVGNACLSMESDPVLENIDREISTAVITSIGRAGHKGPWAAFFTPDGAIDCVLPRSGHSRITRPLRP